MEWKIEVKDRPGVFDAVGEGVKKDILDLGITSVRAVSFIQVYVIEGIIAEPAIRRICENLLRDPVSQEYRIDPGEESVPGTSVIEIAYNPGVMDPVEGSTLKGIRDLGIGGVRSVRTARKYVLKGSLSAAELSNIADKLLYNKLIQHIAKPAEHPPHPAPYAFSPVIVPIRKASDSQLEKLSRQGQLFLNLTEMRVIRDHFRSLRRDPTDCELETVAQTWSEHCWHKTFRGRIRYTERAGDIPEAARKPLTKGKKPLLIDGLLKATIMKVTNELKKPWCVSVFKDNSGVIKFDEQNNVCFKVETHNHPSALEPFGGANTGVGGVIRDPMGTGLGAKPVLNTDVFCFGPPDYPFAKLPPGTLHPKRVMKGVVAGVKDYGNKMGIPTVNGAVLFHEKFIGNPLVYCGTVGIMPKDKSFKKVSAGELVVVAGGRTGRDGIHGATFSSGELTQESEKVSSGAVQIGNPIQEKKLLDAMLQCRDLGLYNAITDCGAGGLSSAVGEMGAELGVRVDLDRVPLKYAGLSYTEIWISESQERMTLSVPRENLARLMEVFKGENVEATVIGEFTRTGRLELFYKGNRVCDMDMDFLHEGHPRTEKKAEYVPPKLSEPSLRADKDLTATLRRLLGHYDTCSKEWVIRQYDHEVQGGSVLKPLVGRGNDGPSDAAISRPLAGSNRGVIVSNGINFRYGFIDPYWMAAACIDEALRQIIASGGSLAEVALLDNFCWGNPDKPDRLGGLVRCAYGCYDTAKAFGVPFISGKDSLYNEFTVDGKSIAIPGTLLISAIAVMDDCRRAVSMYAKEPGDLIYVAGATYDELGGSHYYDLSGATGRNVPLVRPKEAKALFDALSVATGQGLVKAMHDCSEGGIAVAAAEMAFAGGLGMDLFLAEVPFQGESKKDETILFSESNSRFIVEVAKKDQARFERLLKGNAYGLAGCVSAETRLRVNGLDGSVRVNARLSDLKRSWQESLRW
ncbi:MAG: phosphoribosylformylglycinamidine synthase subunit PurL [Deltaproteobacteria bacterium]